MFGQVFRGNDHDWNVPPFRAFVMRFQKLEAIHSGHHQIQKDRIWKRLFHAIEGFLAVGRGLHVPPALVQSPFQHVPGQWIVVDDQHRSVVSTER